jgi:hypothetical protein
MMFRSNDGWMTEVLPTDGAWTEKGKKIRNYCSPSTTSRSFTLDSTTSREYNKELSDTRQFYDVTSSSRSSNSGISFGKVMVDKI